MSDPYNYNFEENYTIEGDNSRDFHEFEAELLELLEKYGYKLKENQ